MTLPHPVGPHPRPTGGEASTERAPRADVRRRIDRRRSRRRPDHDVVASRCRCLEGLVAHTFGLGRDDLRAASRGEAPVAFARQVAMYVAHVWLAMSLSEVGRRFERDRTTVAHACRVVEDRRDDPRVDRVVTALESATDAWRRFARDLDLESE